MKDEYTGGPAFPAAHFDLADHEHGMSLRDYFAAKVMQTICREVDEEGNYWLPHQVAELAYDQADAMLKARQA